MARQILIRFDDICPTMDYTQWGRAMEILERYNVRPLLGVIPDCQDPDLMIEPAHTDFWDYMRSLQSKGFTLAMHGVHHKYDRKQRGIVNLGENTEFAGHPYSVQYEKIHKGKELLLEHGIQTDIFFAPAHSYDEVTLRALAENGFRYVSDGKSLKPFWHSGVICIPCRSNGVGKMERAGYYTAVFHAHEWSRPDKAYAYQQLQELCSNYSDEIVDFATYVQQPLGNSQVQILCEKANVFWNRRCKPVLRPIKKKLLHIR